MTDHRPLHLSRDQADAIDLGSRLLNVLASVEHAHMLGDEEAVISILAGVDPIEVRLTANVLQSLSMLWHTLQPSQIRGGTEGVIGSPPGSLPPDVSAAASDGEQPPPPIPLHGYSVKVPGCS